MKKIYLTFFIIVLALPTWAVLRTQEQAAAVASCFFACDNGSQPAKAPAQAVPVRLIYTQDVANEATPAIYLFQSEQDSSSCVFIAASDKVNDILGYTDKTNHHPQSAGHDLPPALELWLEAMADEIAVLEKNPDRIVHAPTNRVSISPLLKDETGAGIQWNQTSPFNLYCPYLDKKQTVTGCVATALAQIMRYYQYPQRPTGKVSYFWKQGNQTLSIQYDTVPDYVWKDMKSIKDKYYYRNQKEAVSQLMRDIGYAVNMNYGPSSSASMPTSVAAMPKYFDYNSNILYLGASAYTTEVYEDLIYQSLANQHPVLLTGAKAQGGVHAFVCDGVNSSGLFHINWGWGGDSNGYFTLSLLDPKGTGTGGSTAEGGYCVQRHAVFNIQPSTDTNILPLPENMYALAADSITISRSYLSKGETLQMYVGKIINTQGKPWSGRIGILYSGKNLDQSYWVGGYSDVTDFKPGYLREIKNNIEYKTIIELSNQPGTYYLTPYYKTKAEGAQLTAMPVDFGPQRVRLTLDETGLFTLELTDEPEVPEITTDYAPLGTSQNKGVIKRFINNQIVIEKKGKSYNLLGIAL